MNLVSYEGSFVSPNKVICIGRNYVEHIKELGNEIPKEMVIFFKPNSSVSSELKLHDEQICHYESELSFLIQDNELVAVSFGLDLTKRKLQSELKAKSLPWERAKAFRGSAVFSEFVSFKNLEDLRLELYINNKLVQNGGVDLMINKPKDILKEVLTFSDVFENDILMSGTPKGVEQLNKGDELVGRILQKDEVLVSKKWVVSK